MKIPTKKQTSDFLRILATASLTGVGFALGGTMGSEFMKGIFINLTSSVIEGGATKLKEQWLYNKSGALNHDIQQALSRATIKALENLEKRYLALFGDSISEHDKESIKNLFKDLNEETKNAFLASLEKALVEKDVKEYLYGNPAIAANKIWDRISHTSILEDVQRKWFKDYFINNFSLKCNSGLAKN